MIESFEHQDGNRASELGLATTVRDNSVMLRQLLDQVVELRELIEQRRDLSDRRDSALANEAAANGEEPACDAAPAFWEAEREDLEAQIGQLQARLDDLQQQNHELAGRVADSSVRQVITTAEETQTWSWEQRKKQILKQLEEDSFDAESFLTAVPAASSKRGETPRMFVERLTAELDSRNREVEELRHLLDQQSETRSGQVAIGASAIAELIDRDELVQQERQRLKQLQSEWEEKFREGEIEASLERAKLSRERQELAKKQLQLDEQLEHIRRELRQQQDGTPQTAASSRRWLVKLGLCDHQ